MNELTLLAYAVMVAARAKMIAEKAELRRLLDEKAMKRKRAGGPPPSEWYQDQLHTVDLVPIQAALSPADAVDLDCGPEPGSLFDPYPSEA